MRKNRKIAAAVGAVLLILIIMIAAACGSTSRMPGSQSLTRPTLTARWRYWARS